MPVQCYHGSRFHVHVKLDLSMKKSLRHATHDMSLRHATAMADTILSQVQCNQWKTHMISQRPAGKLATWVSQDAMHAVAKVEPGPTFAMSRCDSHVAAIFNSINRA